MIILLSPSKSQNFQSDEYSYTTSSLSEFSEKTAALAPILQNKSVTDIAQLMQISPVLAQLNHDRFQNWTPDFVEHEMIDELHTTKPALAAFTGAVYQQLNLATFSTMDFDYAQKKLRILSGFYGVVRPLDLIKPYRLEMGTRIPFSIGKDSYKNLYDYWRDDITAYFDELSVTDGPIINLASQEYANVIDRTDFEGEIIDIAFKVMENRTLSTVAIYAKQARGAMADLLIRHRVRSVDDVKKMKPRSFAYSAPHSTQTHLVFILRK